MAACCHLFSGPKKANSIISPIVGDSARGAALALDYTHSDGRRAYGRTIVQGLEH